MDSEKLIERLYQHDKDYGEGRTQDFFRVCLDCKDAATALEQLQAENERLRRERDAAVKDYRVLPENCVCITTCGGKKVTIVLDVEAVKKAAHD